MRAEDIVPYQPKEADSRGPIVPWVRDRVMDFQEWRQAREERRTILSDNRLARERLSTLAARMKGLFESPGYQSREHQGSRFGSTYSTIAHFNDPIEGAGYMPWVSRHDGGESFGVWVVTQPLDRTNFSTGSNDGDWFLQYHTDWLSRKKNAGLVVTEGKLQGDWYLGRRHTNFEENYQNPNPLKEINITSDYTELDLREVYFGGGPSVHISLRSWGVDPKTGEEVGPIGRMREVRVLGLSRKINPIGPGGVMDSDTATIPLPDDFTEEFVPIDLPRGGISLGIALREGMIHLQVESTWQRPPDRQLYVGGKPVVYEGPTKKILRIPSEYVNGSRVIDLLERAASRLIESYAQTPPKLPQG